MHANLNENHSRVILANLPFQPMVMRAEDGPVYDEAVKLLAAAAESGPVTLYQRLVDQGKTTREAKSHVFHRFGVRL